MRTKITVFLICMLFTCMLHAQEPKVIMINSLQKVNLKTGGAVKKLLKKSSVAEDSLLKQMDAKSLRFLHRFFPGNTIMIADTSLMNRVYASSPVAEMFTSSHLEKIAAAEGFRKLQRYNQNESAIKYFGLQITEESKTALQLEMIKQDAAYLILMNKVDFSSSGRSGFMINYEVYDRDLNRMYGDKYVRFMKVSGNTYYSAFLFYLDYSLEGFFKNLVQSVASVRKT